MQVLLDPSSLQTLPKDAARDMLLLENKLPMMLLDKLGSMLKLENKKVKLLVLKFTNFPTNVNEGLTKKDYSHLLDMYRAELQFQEGNGQKLLQHNHLGMKLEHVEMGHEIQLATRFHKAGIKLKKGCNLTNVNFDENKGVSSLPFIEMNANIESSYLNVMVFEKLFGIDNIVGSFIILVGNLLEKDKVDSFYQLAKGKFLDMSGHYPYVYNSLNEHCKRPWRIWWTTLKDVNFQSPWTIISTLSASIGFVFLTIQTVYGVYGYYLPRRF
ncbi:UPF0481 protein At3g47200-like [Cucurbita moschata]|uniref:UPF0481 protein At3g47200-like n=1 Tax=Cucurbita moschata TaxID=3662 RepID=A0A6J1EC85_CUCMO|nr:UPF0481 protein At3g47200-like [Cucurbita moschata]